MNISKIKISEQDRKLVSVFMGEEYPLEIDFNWLMPIVEKIKPLYKHEDYYIFFGKLLSARIWETKENIWLAVVEFIKFYNKNKIS